MKTSLDLLCQKRNVYSYIVIYIVFFLIIERKTILPNLEINLTTRYIVPSFCS